MVPTAWQDEALARDGVSREVPCSALKGETVPDSLPATPKSPPTRRVPPRGTPRVPAPLPLSPLSPPDRDRRGDSPAWSGRGSRPSRRTSGLGIKLVTCVIILLRTRAERAFEKSCSLAPPKSTAAETQMSEHTRKHIYTRQ